MTVVREGGGSDSGEGDDSGESEVVMVVRE